MDAHMIHLVTETDLLTRIKDGVSKIKIWEKPMLLLTKDGDDYNHICDLIADTFCTLTINTDALNYDFIRIDNRLEASWNGNVYDLHHPEIDLYEYLGGPLGYDEKIHHYCVGLAEYEAKPVISMICIGDKGCSIENIPAWIEKQFDIVMYEC